MVSHFLYSFAVTSVTTRNCGRKIEQKLTPLRPITSSGVAWMHINLKPLRVMPFAGRGRMSKVTCDNGKRDKELTSDTVGLLKKCLSNGVLFLLGEL